MPGNSPRCTLLALHQATLQWSFCHVLNELSHKFGLNLQGMILGEVEFTVHKDASGTYCAEGTPGATTIRCVELGGLA